MAASITATDVKGLRDRTGAAMMDCKAALEEASSDVEKAIEILRVKGQASAAKRSGRETGEGRRLVGYIHAGGRSGRDDRGQCETGFVARNEEFGKFAREVAIHVAGSPTPPRYVSAEEIQVERDAERRVHEAKAKEEGKPDSVVDRIVEGQLAEVGEAGRPPRPGAHSHGSLRGQDDRGDPRRDRRQHRREHSHRALRALRGRRGVVPGAPGGRNRDAANVLRTQCAGDPWIGGAVTVAAVTFTVAAAASEARRRAGSGCGRCREGRPGGRGDPQRPLEAGEGFAMRRAGIVRPGS